MNDTHANAGKDLGGQGPGGQGLGKGSGGVVVGIDLGTTNSLVAVCDERGPRVLVGGGDGGGGGGLIPSVVRVEGVDGQGRPVVTVGRDAKERAAEFPARTIASIKRLMGRGVREAQSDSAYLTYELSPGPRDTARAKVRVDGREVVLSPEEVSAMILREVKRVAEEALGTRVERAVVTVPAYFDDAQRQATRVAARLAGLEAVRIVPEPTAAALAYGIGLRRAKERNAPEQSHVCVYDLGGGTFDVSVLRLTPAEAEAETDFYQVLASAGDTHLGGDDVDHLLVDLFTRELRERLGVEAGASPALARTLLARAEEAKIELSSRERVRVRVETDKGLYEREVTRAELEALIAPLVDRTMEACARALADARRAGLPEGPLDAVVLVGGSTRIPLVRARVREFFGLEPYTALDPDRVVALGASVQGAILSGGRGGALLLDVIPLSLGVETVGGGVAKLILRNSPVPSRATEMFSTSVDNQTAIRLTVYQGEREMASDCRKLGEFTLRGIPPMPAGVPQVRVMFAVDANGVLSVTASERRSGKQASLQVVPNHGLTEEEVRAIERESVVHAREDMQRHRIADLITSAKLDAHWIGSKLTAHRGLLEEAYAKGLEARLEEVRGLAAQGAADWRSVDANAFQKAKEALERESMRLQEIAIAQVLRERAASEGGGDGRAGGSGGSGGGQG